MGRSQPETAEILLSPLLTPFVAKGLPLPFWRVLCQPLLEGLPLSRGEKKHAPPSPLKAVASSLVMSSTMVALLLSHTAGLGSSAASASATGLDGHPSLELGPPNATSAREPQVRVWWPRSGPSTPWPDSCSSGCAPCLSPGRSPTGSVSAPACGWCSRRPPWAGRRWYAASGSASAGIRSGWGGRSCLSEGPSGWCSWQAGSGGCTPAGPGGLRILR